MICCGKKKPPMKYGFGEKKDKCASCTSFMFGVDSIPYCWAAKSMRKETGAIMRAVEWVRPMVVVVDIVWDIDELHWN
jgi:hypothetical protein